MPAVEPIRSPGSLACIEQRLQPFLEIDARLLGTEPPGAEDITTLAGIVDHCRGLESDSVAACAARDVADRFFDRSGESTGVSGIAAATREGSTRCMPLSLLAMTVAACAGVEIEAVIYREHVAVSEPSSPEAVFDLLDGGQPVSADTMRALHPFEPTGKRRRPLSGMVPLYLDSLATDPVNKDSEGTVRALLDAARDADPRDPRLMFNRGVFLLRAEEFEPALDALLAAEKRGWVESDLHAYIGLALEHTGDREGALGRFRQALELDSRSRVALDGIQRTTSDAEHP